MAFRSHWLFAAEFCTPGEGYEKGGTEGEGGYFRRNHLVPVPRVTDLDALKNVGDRLPCGRGADPEWAHRHGRHGDGDRTRALAVMSSSAAISATRRCSASV